MSNFKEKLLEVIEENPDVRFVVHPLNNSQTSELLEVFEDKKIYPIPPGLTLEKLRSHAEEEWGTEACYEVNLRGMFTSINNVEHWKQYTNDIIEWDAENGRFKFVEGCE